MKISHNIIFSVLIPALIVAFVPATTARGKKKPGSITYHSNRYDVDPEDNRGVLNGPLLNRKRSAKKDPRLSLKLAIQDLIKTYGDKYPRGREFLARLVKMSRMAHCFLRTDSRAALIIIGTSGNYLMRADD